MSTIKEKWIFNFDINEIEKKQYDNFAIETNDLCENISKLLEVNFHIKDINNPTNIAKCYDDELRLLSEGNKEMRQEIEVKIKELRKQQDQYESYKKDQKLLSQEIKETHEAFLMAKKYYKKFLKIYFTVESRNNETQIVFIQFFTESKKDSESYSVRLLRHIKSGHYSLQSLHPKLKNFKELEKKLVETNDVPGILCCIRQAYSKIRGNKKK